jgi:hypothetical protein
MSTAEDAPTTIAVKRRDAADIKQLALDLGRQQGRTVPLWEVVRRLIDTYRATAGTPAGKAT